MGSDYQTHDGTIKSNETASPGWIAYCCDAWDLPDNTAGRVGWYRVYQMTDERMTDAMRAAGREHCAQSRAAEQAIEEAEYERQLAAIMANPADDDGRCPRCGTYCCGDCVDAT